VSLDWFLNLLNIIIIDLALSGDNAIVIGMAAASLPKSQRKKAIIIGGACAIALRISLTAIVTTLFRITLLSAIAGAVLFWVAWRLLKMDVEEEEGDQKTRKADNFRQAIVLILMADFMMSLDNVLSIAGAAHGNYLLLIIGLLISMPLLMTTGGFISGLIDKFKWIPFLGAAAITFTAMRMILEDQFIEPRLGISTGLIIPISIAVGLIFPTIIFLFNKWRAKKKAEPQDSGSMGK
jgi:YjbE family integral membrane protein